MILADTFEWSTFPDAIRFIRDNPHLLLDKSLQQLGLAIAALAIAVAIALPLGVVLGHFHRGSFVAISVANLGRALPSLVLIAFGLLVFGIGFWNNANRQTLADWQSASAQDARMRRRRWRMSC